MAHRYARIIQLVDELIRLTLGCTEEEKKAFVEYLQNTQKKNEST